MSLTPHSDRDPSPTPSSSSSSFSPSPNASRVNLPPNHISADGYWDGEAPNVLVDRALGLHSKGGARPALGSRAGSLMSVLSGRGQKAAKSDPHGESEGLLAGQDGADEGDDDLARADQQHGGAYRRSARSRSKSQWRKLKWYQRPSPVW